MKSLVIYPCAMVVLLGIATTAFALDVNAEKFLSFTGLKSQTEGKTVHMEQGRLYAVKVINAERLASVGCDGAQDGQLLKVKYLGDSKWEVHFPDNKVKQTVWDWHKVC